MEKNAKSEVEKVKKMMIKEAKREKRAKEYKDAVLEEENLKKEKHENRLVQAKVLIFITNFKSLIWKIVIITRKQYMKV